MVDSAICANASCTKKGTKKCAACSSVAYCSRECQKQDWKVHRDICKRFTEAVAQATAAIKEATATALASNVNKSEATDETGPFVFALTAEEEWAARKLYLDEKIKKCELPVERAEKLASVLSEADAEDTALKKLIRLKSFVDMGKAAKASDQLL